MKGLMFCPEMIRALIDGRKTQTRRLGPPRIAVGETAYVKEAWEKNGKKMSPLFMPESLARLHLRILAVREQPLLDITGSDAMAEGVREFIGWTDGDQCIHTDARPGDAINNSIYPAAWRGPGYVAGYALLWNQLQRERPAAERVPWNSNPMVTAYTFEVIHG